MLLQFESLQIQIQSQLIMQEAQQKVLLHDLARALIFDKTASEKMSNEKAQELTINDQQETLIDTVYARIAEKKPHLLSKLNYLGSKKAAITEKSELLSPTIIDEDTASQNDSKLLQDEIVTTQLSQVAYHLRQKKRAFDKACLLELLGKDFMGRQSCLLTSRDLSKSCSDELRPKVFQMTQNSKILQLLLALSQDPSGEQPPSNFAKNYLQRKMRYNEDQALFIKPHLGDYLQNDCKLIERDKTSSGRQAYLNYDTSSFENPLFKKLQVADLSKTGPKPYTIDSLENASVNRFNYDLLKQTQQNFQVDKEENYQVGLSASGGQEPAPLLGATLRSLDQAGSVIDKSKIGKLGGLFGAGESTGERTFGMTLQIPSLPPIDQATIFHEDGSIDTKQVQPTFSFFQPSSSSEALQSGGQQADHHPEPVAKPKGKLTITAQSSSGSSNKRHQKQNDKKHKKQKVSVWSLMAYVDESVLDNNILKESGIARLWEDESLHIHLRNLSVSEPGVITLQKEESFKACFKASVAGVIRVPDSSKTIKEKDLVRSLILVLQGIPSKQVFELDKTTFTFNTNPNLVIGDMCCNSESLQQLCQEFTQAGCYFLHLREFSEFMCSHKSTGAGQVVEAFALAIQEFLIFYQHQVNELERKAKAHRDSLDTSDDCRSNLTDKFVSLLQIKVLMAPLLTQIESIASICFTSKFIEDIHLQKQEANDKEADQSVDAANNDFAFVSLLYQRNALTSANLKEQIEENLERIRSQAWLNQFPRGARLLTYLYRIMIASEADLQVIELLRKVFAQAVRPILLMVSEFITIGSFKDPFDEFFVEKLYRNNAKASQGGPDQKQQSSDQSQAPVNEDDFIYKFTSDKTKVPVFLAANDSALMIFKIGCDLNLLKTKRQQILTDSQHQNNILVLDSKASNTRVNLPDYFAICATGDQTTQRNNCSMIDQASRELKLEFSMQQLQDNQNREQLLYEKQSEMLQAIEQQIAKEETNALLEQILQREKASVFRQTEREKQLKLQAEAKQNQKRQYMQQIEDDIAQRKKNRELKDQVDQAEKDRVKQEQIEYERIKKEVAENLKQQLMEILKENQTLADTRTEDAIQKEALERQVSELEARAEQTKQEVVVEEILTPSPSPTPTKSDQEMKDERHILQSDASKQLKSDESMLIDSVPSVKQESSIDPAGKKSTVKDGGLAGLVFGQGEEAHSNSSSDEKMRVDSGHTDSPDSVKRDDDENRATVKVDDIQLELARDEKQLIDTKIEKANPELNLIVQPEETSLEKKNFIESVFIKPLISRVFKIINEKQQIDSKRKTWNLKHQVSQIEALQRKKTDWDYHSAQKTSLKSRMDAIFREFQDDNESQKHQEVQIINDETQDESKDNMFNVPVTLAIEQSIISIVQNQHKLVNKCLLHMMHRGMFLLRHLEYLKMILLASQGDVFFSLHEAVFNDDFQQTAKDSSLQFLNMQLEHAIRSSRPERNYSRKNQSRTNTTTRRQVDLSVNLTQLISEDGTELTKFKFVASGKSNQMKSNPNFFFTISNIGEYVRLDYSIEHPLDRVISQQCMNKYNTLFFFLLKLKRVNHCLTLIWKELNGVEFRRISPSDFKELRKLQFLWQQMQYFLRTIDEYIMVAVVQSQWSLLKQQLAQINYFEELISLHNAYLDTILEKCFLARARDNRLQITLNQIFDFVFKLHFLVRNYGVGVCRDQQAKQDLQNISNSFRDYSRFMYQIVRNLSHKGQFKELFVRLDFNKFYQNTTIASQAASGFTRNINK